MKIMSIALALLLILSMLFMVSCNGNEAEDSTSPNDSDSASESDESAEESSSEQVYADLLIDEDYILVYDSDTQGLFDLADGLKLHINGMYGLGIEIYSDKTAPANKTKRIIVGDADDRISTLKSQINEKNDFIADVMGDDLILYATAPQLYEYLIETVKEKYFTRSSMPIVSHHNRLIYSDSEYKELNYAQYLRNKKNALTAKDLEELFEARSFTADNGVVLPYRIYVPSDYEIGKTPLLLYLHGAGERGDNNSYHISKTLPSAFSLENSPYANAIIVAPQCPANEQWVDTPWENGNYSVEDVPESAELAAVVELLGKIGEDYKPDADRYYVMGISMGGFGTWDIIMRHTELFAAAIPICGGADPSLAEKVKDLHIWTMHGTVDSLVPYAGTKEMSDAIKATGSEKFSFTSMEGMNHNIWELVAQDRQHGEWLFAKKR